MTRNKADQTLLARRRALKQIGGLTAYGLMPGLASMLSMQSAEAAGSYKALVCVFLFGGNDANNMIVPTDSTNYATYLTSRGGMLGTPSNGALALPNAGQTGGVLQLAAARGEAFHHRRELGVVGDSVAFAGYLGDFGFLVGFERELQIRAVLGGDLGQGVGLEFVDDVGGGGLQRGEGDARAPGAGPAAAAPERVGAQAGAVEAQRRSGRH